MNALILVARHDCSGEGALRHVREARMGAIDNHWFEKLLRETV